MKNRFAALMVLTIVFFTDTFAQKYKFGKVSKEELEEKFYPLDSTAEAAFLYKNKSVRFEYNTVKGYFEKVEEVFVRIKIYNKEGFENGNQSILYYNPDQGSEEEITGIKAVTYNLINGKIEEQKVKKKEIYLEKKNKYYSYKKIPFPNVKEGSVLELKYRLASQYFHVPLYWVQEDIPIKKVQYRTTVPEYFKFNKTTKGYFTITPKTEYVTGSVTFGTEVVTYNQERNTFEGENIPALKNDEPFTNNYNNYRGVVSLELASYQFPGDYIRRFSNSWSDVCRKLYDSYSFGHELKKKSYFEQDLEVLLTSVGESEFEKMASIFEFVKSKVKWNDYNGVYTDVGVSKAYSKGEGNISEVNLILVAMLREAGLNAHPVVLSTKRNGVPLFPTIDGLNYVIAGVENESGAVVLLDASEKYSSANVLPTRDMNWEGRMLINKDRNVAVSLVSKKISDEFYMANVSFDENFKLTGTVMAKYTGREALKFRNKSSDLSDEKLKESLEEKFKIDLDKVDLKNKKNVYKPVMASLQVSSENYCETISGKKYISPLVFLEETENPFKLETRKYPVDLVSPFKETKTVMIKIPEGYKIVSIPQSVKVQMNNNAGSFTFLIKQIGNMISVKSVKQFNTSQVSTHQYNELRDLYKNVVTKNKEKIVLEKITVASAH